MPESWLNVATKNAIRIGFQYFFWNRGSEISVCDIESFIWFRAAVTLESPILLRTLPASESLPISTSHLGLSGIV